MEEHRLADPATTVLETAGACRASHQIAAGLERSLAVNDFTTVEPLLADLVERRGLALAPGTIGWAELARSVMRGLIAAHRVDALRDLGVYEHLLVSARMITVAAELITAPMTNATPMHSQIQPSLTGVILRRGELAPTPQASSYSATLAKVGPP
jgi:hypothetical protein